MASEMRMERSMEIEMATEILGPRMNEVRAILMVDTLEKLHSQTVRPQFEKCCRIYIFHSQRL